MERQKIHKGFEENAVKVLVATIAFGMGIDKQDIQGIIHFNMPKSIENYLQEVFINFLFFLDWSSWKGWNSCILPFIPFFS